MEKGSQLPEVDFSITLLGGQPMQQLLQKHSDMQDKDFVSNVSGILNESYTFVLQNLAHQKYPDEDFSKGLPLDKAISLLSTVGIFVVLVCFNNSWRFFTSYVRKSEDHVMHLKKAIMNLPEANGPPQEAYYCPLSDLTPFFFH